MQKLIRISVIYITVIITILLIATLLTLRDSVEKNKKTESNINNLQKELDQLAASQQTEKETIQELNNLRSKIAESQNTTVLGANSQASDSAQAATGFVTINDKKWQSVDVYESNSYSSKVIDKIEFDNVYRYDKKQAGWYQIELPSSGTNGWVPGRFLKEVADKNG